MPDADVIAVACAGDGTVRLFRAGDFSPAGTISLGRDADNVRFDPRTGHLLVGYGDALAILDPTHASVLARIGLNAHPEGFQLDPSTRRAIVNVPDALQIAVLDIQIGQQVATWHVPGLRANFPMALDDTGTVVATVFRDPPTLVVLDAKDGTPSASVATCGDADDVFFDAKRHRLYVSCGEGAVDVLEQEQDGYRRVDRIATSSGARTSLFVPELDLLFVAARAGFLGLGSEAAVLAFRPQPWEGR